MAFYFNKRFVQPLADAWETYKGRVIGISPTGLGMNNPTFIPSMSVDSNGKSTGLLNPDGTPLSRIPNVLAQSAIPSILAPNGTVATNGAITLGTALPTIYANAWVYLPAGAVVGGAAGMYFCKFSSTTVGQVYTNFVDASTTAFTPYIPGTQVAAVGSNAAYTQTTGIAQLTNTTIPANSMGPNGSIRVTSKYTCPNNANAKIIYQLLSTATIYSTSAGMVSSVGGAYQGTITNRGVTNSQIGVAGFGIGGASQAVYSSIDTTINQPQLNTVTMTATTDYIVLEAFIVEILPA